MKRRKKEVDNEVELELNMTSMIDVVFLLIIFFMTVTELNKLDAKTDIRLPAADEAHVKEIPPGRLVINIQKLEGGGAAVYLGGRRVNFRELQRLLHVAAVGDYWDPETKRSDREVLVRADRDTPWRHVQDIMVECSRQKLHRVSLATKVVDRS